MKNKKGVILKRQQIILQKLQKEKEVTVKDLVEELNVSPLTIRRDLEAFELKGVVKRYHGGATLIEGTLLEDPAAENLHTEEEKDIDYKRIVAKHAASLIADGDTVFINSSRTALLILDYIHGKHVNVITNNGNALNCNHDSSVNIVLTGGEVYSYKNSMVGDFALSTIRKVWANKCFIGVSGVTAEGDISTAILQETMVNSLMIEQSKDMVVILAEHTKLGKRHNFIIGNTKQITHLVTDYLADETILKKISDDHITILKGGLND